MRAVRRPTLARSAPRPGGRPGRRRSAVRPGGRRRARRRTRVPVRRQRLPHLRRDGVRGRRDRGRVPVDRPALLDRTVVPGPRSCGRSRSPTTSRPTRPSRRSLFDGLHHGDEHMSLEMTLAILRWLTQGYGDRRADPRTSSTAARSGSCSPSTRMARRTTSSGPAATATGARTASRRPGSSSIGTDVNRNYGYRWGCCGGSSSTPSSSRFRGPKAFSTPEASAFADFVREPGRPRPPADPRLDQLPHDRAAS